ncbi:hypothetical protein NGDEOPKE_00193 [Enterococcus phage vB_OCPT_Carl]|uniref:Uncharacterized protein n=2 Tax=Kochikohdavirus TaxID=2560160 RepID=A8E2G5_BPPHE|nr:hypothetical protein EFP_gp113 [Enterococcus phage EF24C]AZV00030.1 hypothetical protein vBEfaHEF1TV_185 [Enterococcus phage vB_EfaH_EF1TV]UQT00142.1 hypothetical protein NGDEOPKE_00193 [Enterococcus phage vB_OCPT_Carl]UQT00355.1 hypothetical protein EGEOBHOM_00203 [Enterococcus phage vB_OCPT_Car]BAF81381.1 hypothetical protein EFP_113 [Enterococcus phage EF24C]
MFKRLEEYRKNLSNEELKIFNNTMKLLNDNKTDFQERTKNFDKELQYTELENEKEKILIVLDTIRVSNENYKNVISENLYHSIKEMTIIFELLYNL